MVCPAAIRDAEVWQTEAAITGWGGTLKVISYHQLAQKKAAFDPLKYQAIIFDEAEPLDNEVLTPDGWRRMGDLAVGDEVVGGDGLPTSVIGVYPRGVTEVYRVTFSDGSHVDCSPDHVWSLAYKGRTLTTLELKAYADRRDPAARRWKRIPLTGPVEYAKSGPLPVDPYVLGLVLGDGSFTRSTPWLCAHEDDLADTLAALCERIPAGDRIGAVGRVKAARAFRWSIAGGGLARGLRGLGLHGVTGADKFVPDAYLRASVGDRYDLLRGLMDSDGHVRRAGGSAQFVNTSEHLIDAVVEIARSLGGTARKRWGEAGGAWQVVVQTPECPFLLPRKASKWRGGKLRNRSVSSVRRIDDAPTQCIEVRNEDGLYVTGRGFVVTHNCHWLKNRKVTWGLPGLKASKLIPKTYMGSGTPTPNDASELWGQLRMIRHDIPAFWRWADGNTKPDADGWFHVGEKRNKRGDLLSSWVIGGELEACVRSSCHNAERVTDQDCEHWAEFRRMEQEGYMLGRSEELLDLPPMSGYDTPLWAPMKPAQKKLYNDLKADFLASLPAQDIELEAISASHQFAQLWQLSTGVSSVDPEQDTDDKLSGKWPLVAEFIEDRKNPVLVGTYFKNSAAAMVRLCKRLGVRYATFGSQTSAPARKEAVRAFQAGELDVMIGSIPVIGEGLTLTAGDSVLLVERMWTPDKNAQVVRRVRRRGQDKPVGVRQFVTPDSIDEGQWEALKLKRDRISRVDVAALVNGAYKEA